MTGFEPRISGCGSDCPTNWATTPDRIKIKFLNKTYSDEPSESS